MIRRWRRIVEQCMFFWNHARTENELMVKMKEARGRENGKRKENSKYREERPKDIRVRKTKGAKGKARGT